METHLSRSKALAAQSRLPAPPSPWPDRLAIGASAACLVHCLLLPLIVAAAPAASRLLFVEEFHLLAFAVAVPVSAWAMIGGYRRHGLILPAMLGSAGLALLGAGTLAGARELAETGLSLAGSVTLAAAHVRNWQLRNPPAA